MAKKSKPEKLLPDMVVADNIELIRHIGHTATHTEIADAMRAYAFDTFIHRYSFDYACEKANAYLLSKEGLNNLCVLKCINNWYHGGRQIYVFDDDFASLLSGQGKSDLHISAETLTQLPCKSFYVQRKYQDSLGFFVDIQDNDICMAEFFDGDRPDGFVMRFTADDTVEGILQKMVGAETTINDSLVAEYAEMLQFVVYLSAVNAEIVPVTKRQVQKKTATQRPQKPSAQPQKSAIANVGYRIGVAVRKHRQAENAVDGQHSPQGHSAPKAPHIRRAHFHGYHTNNGYQVKWLNTIFVNAERDDNDISTVHKVLQ